MVATVADDVVVGQRCEILSTGTGLRASLKRYGTIAFVGEITGLPTGQWIGVRLDRPLGKNDGTVAGERYFECPPLHGAFVRRDKISLHDGIPEAGGSDIVAAMEERRMQHGAVRERERKTRLDNHEQTADELIQSFWQRFTEQEERIRRNIGAFVEQKKQPVPCAPSEEIKLDDLVAKVHVMREDAAAGASMFLSPYDIRQSQLIIGKLLDTIEATRTTFAPRKKFTFKSRTKSKTVTEAGNRVDNNNPANPDDGCEDFDDTRKASLYVNPDELVFADRRDEVIVIDAATFPEDDQVGRRRDLSFSRLVNCVIFIAVETSAIRGDDLKNCVVLSGPTWGSLWLEHCHDCYFHVACRQLRVHHSSKTTFHLRIASHPIIEDCHQLIFAPYKLQYAMLDDQLQRCCLHRDSGLWAKVNDFKWHKAQQSPNWSLWDPKQPLRQIPDALQQVVHYG